MSSLAKCHAEGHRDRIEDLEAALKAAQEIFNLLPCYTQGNSVMAEEDVSELFGKYTEAVERVEAWKDKSEA